VEERQAPPPQILRDEQRQVTYLLDTTGGDFAFDTGLEITLVFRLLVLILDDPVSSSETS
jgi:hypothetical protein